MNEVKIQNLNFAYGHKATLKNINLQIGQGLYGLLGRNGAGKTTLMKLIVGILPIQDGQIEICGQTTVKEIRKLVGYLPQNFDFYPEMKVQEALEYLGVLDNIPRSTLNKRINDLLGLVNLENEKNKRIKNLSGGMKRRLGIAQCLLNDPKVLVVDEPTAGLDPEERIRFRNLLSELSVDKVVIFSTHIASDLEKTATELGILEKGNFIYNGSIYNLLDEYTGGTYETIIQKNQLETFKRDHIVFQQQETRDGLLVSFIHHGRPAPEFRRIPSTLESAYLMILYSKEV